MHGIPRLLPEPAHHVVLADIKPRGQFINGQRIGQVQVQILQQRHHLAVAAGGAHPVAAPDHPVHLHHQFRKLRLRQQRRAVAALPYRLRQCLEQRTHAAAALVPVYILECLLCLSEALGGIAVPHRQCAQIVRCDIQDHPLIIIPRLHHRPVDAPATHQHKISRGQLIPFPLHRIASSAGQQNDDLVERMVVVFDIFPPPVRQMKQPKRLLQVAAHLILQWFHALTSAFFVIIIALAMQILQASFLIITILKILFPFCNFCVAFLIDLCYDTSC